MENTQNSDSPPEIPPTPPQRYDIADDTFCLIIALLQIIGGGIGIVIAIYYNALAQLSLLFSLVLAPFPYAIWAGVKMWQGHRRGLIHSMVIQAIQIPLISSTVVYYDMFLGARVSLGWMPPGTAVEFNILSNSYLYLADPNMPSGFAINILALLAFLHLLKVKRKHNHGVIAETSSATEQSDYYS